MMPDTTISARYDSVWQAREAIADLVEGSISPRRIEAEVEADDHTEAVNVFVGNLALRGAGIGATAGILIGMFLRAAVLDGAMLPDFLMAIVAGGEPSATVASVALFGALGTSLGAITGMVRAKVYMPVPDHLDVDSVQLQVDAPTVGSAHRTIEILSRTPAKELHADV